VTTSIDWIAIDRRIARADRALRADRRALRDDPDTPQDWFDADRVVTTRSTFVDASALEPADPLREGLRRWLFRLAIARIAQPAIVEVARARAAPRIELERPEVGRFSLREIVKKIVAEPSDGRRLEWMAGLAHASGDVSARERDLAFAVREIGKRLGVDDPSRLTSPCEPDVTRALAREMLDETLDLTRCALAGCASPSDVLGRIVGQNAPGVWPQTSLFIDEIFGHTPLLSGIEPFTGRPPPVVGASSLVRRLSAFGAAYARAAAPRAAPFVIGHDATETHPRRRGALFAMLLLDRTFLVRMLGFSRGAARGAAKTIATALLASIRLEAARTLLDPATAPPREVSEAMEEALLCPMPAALAAVFPRPCREADVRLVACVLASSDEHSMIERFDEDWFRNPRGLVHLRERDAEPPPLAIDEGGLESAAARLRARLEAAVA
jgi:hypothetical protein